MLLNTCMNVNMRLATTSSWYPFPWQGLFSDNSLTVSKFPVISRFYRQVVTLRIYSQYCCPNAIYSL